MIPPYRRISELRENTVKTIVTGGAGFIGSNLVDELVRRNYEVTVYDNFVSGFKRHLSSALESGKVTLVVADVLDKDKLAKAMEGAQIVFHLAANADVRGGLRNTAVDLEQNIIGTHCVMEAMKDAKVGTIVFTSSATVYGEPNVFPTPEDYAPMQTSLYGASKFSSEAMIQAYCEYFDMRSYIFRFVSWIGERYSHGVIFDFVNKLRQNPHELEILGDGKQNKSYLHVNDGIKGIFLALEHLTDQKNVLNLGHEDYMNVTDLADIVCAEMGQTDVHYSFGGGVRGWIGDSPFVNLDISKMKRVGFAPAIPIAEGVRRTVNYLLENEWLLNSRPLTL